MSPLLPLELLLATCAILLTAYTFRGITGLGSGLIAIPLLALFMPLTFLVPYISFVDVAASLVHGWRHRRHTAWREVLTVLPFTLLGVVLALDLLKSLDKSTLANALGVFVLLFAIYSLVGITLKQQCSPRWSVAAGSLGGMVGRRWKILAALVVLFALGYIGMPFMGKLPPETLNIVVAVIFLFGAVYVVVTISLIKRIILALSE